ncbi:hypothetical protein Q8F55_001155 [Vanrija albida]|uniref:Uncharacterized protein n=1 Tax=Vanrija albida TaxID=181172 RepID=A0ABR3QF86_9TREE
MDFLTATPEPPRNTYPALAVITVGSLGSRRSSLAEEEGGLARVMSGGRRLSYATTNKLDVPPAAGGGGARTPEAGTWFWRVRVGVTELVLLPQTPGAPVFSARPAPAHPPAPLSPPKQGGGDGLGARFLHSVRRFSLSAGRGDEAEPAEGAAPAPTPAAATTAPPVPAPIETGWPAVLDTAPLAAIAVPLHAIAKVGREGSDRAGYRVDVVVPSAVGGKAGALRFEFAADWLGAKAWVLWWCVADDSESEVLSTSIERAVANAPGAAPLQLGGDKSYDPEWQDKVRGKW